MHTVVSKSRIWGARGDGLSGVEGLLAVVGLEVTMEGIRTGTGTERWRERVPDFRGCNAEAARAKWCVDKRSREEISAGESEGTSNSRKDHWLKKTLCMCSAYWSCLVLYCLCRMHQRGQISDLCICWMRKFRSVNRQLQLKYWNIVMLF